MVCVNITKCRGCGACINVCPAQAITLIKDIAHISTNKCTECGRCVNVCPARAINFSPSKNDLNFSKNPTPLFYRQKFFWKERRFWPWQNRRQESKRTVSQIKNCEKYGKYEKN